MDAREKSAPALSTDEDLLGRLLGARCEGVVVADEHIRQDAWIRLEPSKTMINARHGGHHGAQRSLAGTFPGLMPHNDKKTPQNGAYSDESSANPEPSLPNAAKPRPPRRVIRMAPAEVRGTPSSPPVPSLTERHVKQNENRALIQSFRAGPQHFPGAKSFAEPLAPHRGSRVRMHPAVVAPNLARLDRSHLFPIIILMCLAWGGVMVLGISKAMTPPSGMRLTLD